MAFLEDAHGTTWVATDGGGLNRFDRTSGKFQHFSKATSNLNSDAVLSLAKTVGRIWIATWAGGVSRLDPQSGRFTPFTPKNSGMADDHAFAVYTDRGGRVWIGTYQKGCSASIRRPAPSARRSFSEREAEPDPHHHGAVRRTAPARNGRQRHVSVRSDHGKQRAYDVGKDGVSGTSVQAIVESLPASCGSAPRTASIVSIAAPTSSSTSPRRRIAGTSVNGIAVDASGQLWLSGDRGVARFNPPRRGRRRTPSPTAAGQRVQLRRVLQGRDGAIFFGGAKGFNLLEPERITENAHVPPIALTGFQLYNKPVAIGAKGSPLEQSITVAKKLVLHHDQSVFTIEFAALDFVAPEKNQYAYKLEGLDDDWNQVARSASPRTPTSRRQLRLPREGHEQRRPLEPGRRLAGIKVVPPFWASWWFRAIILLGAAFGCATSCACSGARVSLERMNATLAEAAERDRSAQQYLERNVLEVLDAMERFSEGDLSVALEVERDDAIGACATA
jgi:streptogramin lyase